MFCSVGMCVGWEEGRDLGTLWRDKTDGQQWVDEITERNDDKRDVWIRDEYVLKPKET